MVSGSRSNQLYTSNKNLNVYLLPGKYREIPGLLIAGQIYQMLRAKKLR